MSAERSAPRLDELLAELTTLLSEDDIRCAQVACQPGGHVWLVFEHAGRRVVLVWAARRAAEDAKVYRLFGLPLLAGNGATSHDLDSYGDFARRRLGRRWDALRATIALQNYEIHDVPRSAAGFAKLVADARPDGARVWHGWVAEGIEEARERPFEGFLLPYRDGASRVVFALLTAGEAKGATVVARTPLGEVVRLDDTRDADARARPEHQVERHLWWVLGRSLHAGMSWVDAPGARLRLATLLSGTRTPHDLGEDVFFGVWGEQAMSNVPLLSSTGLGGVVNHSNRECTVGMIHVSGNDDRLNFSPWKMPPAKLDNFLITDFDDAAALRGGEERLERAVTEATTKSGKLPIFVTQMCEYGYLNDDMLGVVERVVESTDAAIALMHNPRPKHHALASFNNWWSSVLEGSLLRGAEHDPRGVNLLGLGPPSRARAEVDALLAAVGVNVRAHLFPQLDGRDLGLLHEARLFVATPWLPLGETVGASLSEAKVETLVLPAPYGVRGTRRFLDGILAALRLPPLADAAFDALVATHAPSLAAPRAAPPQQWLGFVIPESCLAEAASAEIFYGLRPFELLEDAGFGVAILTTRARPGAAPLDCASVAHTLGIADPARLHLARRAPGQLLHDALQQLPGSLLYSDYPADARVASAGKMPFSVRHFELGLAGAVRTAETLAKLARVPFFARYQAFVGEAFT